MANNKRKAVDRRGDAALQSAWGGEGAVSRLLTKEKREAILEAYLAGEKVAVIAALYGCHPSYPGLLATRLGYPSRWPETQRRNMADATRKRYLGAKES